MLALKCNKESLLKELLDMLVLKYNSSSIDPRTILKQGQGALACGYSCRKVKQHRPDVKVATKSLAANLGGGEGEEPDRGELKNSSDSPQVSVWTGRCHRSRCSPEWFSYWR